MDLPSLSSQGPPHPVACSQAWFDGVESPEGKLSFSIYSLEQML